jgi:glutamine amidotransferase
MIAIIDYGLGNLRAFANMFKDLRLPHEVTRDPAAIAGASHLVLPGVGHFDRAMDLLERSGLRPVVEEQVLQRSVPVMGVCVGMQMLANRSEEGSLPGLGWIPGDVVRLPASVGNRALPLPHMGWNDVSPQPGAPLFADMPDAPRFYFLHSFHFRCADPSDVMATADYGGLFACAVRRGNVFGVQFHPEKSHGWGRALLSAFASVSGGC